MTVQTQQRGLLFVLVGPGGAGKNALMRDVLTDVDTISQLATATTRAMRSGERQGREHHFVSTETFQKMITEGDLLEWQEVTPNKYYGIPRNSVDTALRGGQHLIADIDVLGAQDVKATYPEDVVLIFISVPGKSLEDRLQILRERMSNEDRNESETHIQQRLERARTLELPFADECDHVIINDDRGTAAQQLQTIINTHIAQRSK